MIAGTVVCSTFKRELLQALHHFPTDLFKIALYDSTAVLDANVTSYVTPGEVTGIGYMAGGKNLANSQVLLDLSSRVAYASWDDAVWDNSVIVARGALIYNQTAGQRAVAVLDFGVDRTSNHGPFHVQFPPLGSSTALIRIF
jgi:hypothetical protein